MTERQHLRTVARRLAVLRHAEEVTRNVSVERLHQTLKRWLAKQPPGATLVELAAQLDRFRLHYTSIDRTARSDRVRHRRSAMRR